MPVRLCAWGNSTGLRISADLLATAGLKRGDLVTVRLTDAGDLRVRRTAKPSSLEEPSAVLTPSPDRVPPPQKW